MIFVRLSREHKTFVVSHLACYDTPSEVRTAFLERFGKEISLSQLAYYDPSNAQSGRELAQEWKDLFAEVRADFISDTGGIAIAQKAYRLRRLDRIAREAHQMRNYRLEMEVLEQAAKEVGDTFTNRRELTGKNGTPLQSAGFTSADIAAARELLDNFDPDNPPDPPE